MFLQVIGLDSSLASELQTALRSFYRLTHSVDKQPAAA